MKRNTMKHLPTTLPSGCLAPNGRGSLLVAFLFLAALSVQTAHGFTIRRGYANAVEAHGNRAYVAGGLAGLVVVDISGGTLHEIRRFASSHSANDIVRAGSFLYMADGNGGLRVFEISSGPLTEHNSLPLPHPLTGVLSNAQDVAIASGADLAVVAGFTDGISFVDITNPTNLQLVAPVFVGIPNGTYGVAIKNDGSLVVVADRNRHVQLIDPSNPSSPISIVKTDDPRDVQIVHVGGKDYAVVADYQSGLNYIDITDPENPGSPIRISPHVGGKLFDVTIDGNCVLGANTNLGSVPIIHFDSNTLALNLVGGINLTNLYQFVTGVAIEGTNVYVTASSVEGQNQLLAASALYKLNYNRPPECP